MVTIHSFCFVQSIDFLKKNEINTYNHASLCCQKNMFNVPVRFAQAFVMFGGFVDYKKKSPNNRNCSNNTIIITTTTLSAVMENSSPKLISIAMNTIFTT